MDFQALLHDELSTYFPSEEDRRRAELAGLLRSGVVERRGKELFLRLSHPSLALLKKCLILKKEFYPSVSYELFLSKERGIRAGAFYHLEIGVSSEMLEAFGFYNVSRLSEYLTKAVASDFIRGVFVLRGYVANPLRSYQLEIRFPSKDWAVLIQHSLEGQGMSFRCRQMKSEWCLYTKNVSTMSLFLGYIGMCRSNLELERIRVEKETVGNLTRWVNYTTSNLERTVRSSSRQREKIRHIPLELLSPKLQEIAMLRLRYPYASLRELGTYCSPPLSKGEVHRRLRALEKEAEKLWRESPQEFSL